MDINQEIAAIHDRNRKVEVDKAWETSWARRFVIAAMTYIIALVWLFVIKNSSPWLNAFIPAVGYVLSTLSLPFIKDRWSKSKK